MSLLKHDQWRNMYLIPSMKPTAEWLMSEFHAYKGKFDVCDLQSWRRLLDLQSLTRGFAWYLVLTSLAFPYLQSHTNADVTAGRRLASEPLINVLKLGVQLTAGSVPRRQEIEENKHYQCAFFFAPSPLRDGWDMQNTWLGHFSTWR